MRRGELRVCGTWRPLSLATPRDRGRRCVWPAQSVAVFASRRLPCAARLGGARQNSLRGLWPLRSNSCRESVDEARGYARRPQGCAARRPTQRRPHTPPAAQETGWALVREPGRCCKGLCGWGLRRDLEAPRSAGFMARARTRAPRPLTHGNCSSAAAEGRAASFAVGPWTRASQGSRPAGPTASNHAASLTRTALCRSVQRNPATSLQRC